MRRREFITLIGGGTATLLFRSPGARAVSSPHTQFGPACQL
jgi:hypothetical protein